MTCLIDVTQGPLVMGILNVTPDSFSDGGEFQNPSDAVRRGMVMINEGADIIDIGGESTRPGAQSVSVEMEIGRVASVIHKIKEQIKFKIANHAVALSVDTAKSEVAKLALEAGACMINDVSAGLGDPAMFDIVRHYKAHIVLMHMQGCPLTMQDSPNYLDVVDDVLSFLAARVCEAEKAGISRDRILIDPGIGFGKKSSDNIKLIASLERFVSLGLPVVLGASRKRFMGSICKANGPRELVGATVATTVIGALKGVSVFRVHDVKENRQALDVTKAIQGINRKPH